mmetsp:Transcript_7497/g.13547  ORF Transcript_7497/g.13547 Transcript_7497/m.13547 type:complete len:523 (-) Transcript_7497:78-1646(-)
MGERNDATSSGFESAPPFALISNASSISLMRRFDDRSLSNDDNALGADTLSADGSSDSDFDLPSFAPVGTSIRAERGTLGPRISPNQVQESPKDKTEAEVPVSNSDEPPKSPRSNEQDTNNNNNSTPEAQTEPDSLLTQKSAPGLTATPPSPVASAPQETSTVVNSNPPQSTLSPAAQQYLHIPKSSSMEISPATNSPKVFNGTASANQPVSAKRGSSTVTQRKDSKAVPSNPNSRVPTRAPSNTVVYTPPIGAGGMALPAAQQNLPKNPPVRPPQNRGPPKIRPPQRGPGPRPPQVSSRTGGAGGPNGAPASLGGSKEFGAKSSGDEMLVNGPDSMSEQLLQEFTSEPGLQNAHEEDGRSKTSHNTQKRHQNFQAHKSAGHELSEKNHTAKIRLPTRSGAAATSRGAVDLQEFQNLNVDVVVAPPTDADGQKRVSSGRLLKKNSRGNNRDADSIRHTSSTGSEKLQVRNTADLDPYTGDSSGSPKASRVSGGHLEDKSDGVLDSLSLKLRQKGFRKVSRRY